jgi:hypothetical protein
LSNFGRVRQKGGVSMENQKHLNAVGEITEMIYKATHKDEE